MERISWTDLSGVQSKAVVGAAIAHDHGHGQVTYTPETVHSITREAGVYTITLEGGRQPFIRVPEEWVTASE